MHKDCLEDGETYWVAEVKSTTNENEEKQLRLGLGQVLRYHHVSNQSRKTRAVLVAEGTTRQLVGGALLFTLHRARVAGALACHHVLIASCEFVLLGLGPTDACAEDRLASDHLPKQSIKDESPIQALSVMNFQRYLLPVGAMSFRSASNASCCSLFHVDLCC